MKRIKLNRQEKKIEDALLGGQYRSVNRETFEEIAGALKRRRKDSVLNIRINSEDLTNIKNQASKLGIKYQTFISEILHRVAQS